MISRISSVWLRHPDIFFALIFLSMLAVFLVPLPPFLLDALLVLSFGLSLTILIVVLIIQHTEELVAFPTWLLVSTLFRLALNVASTRLILTCGHQGSQAAGDMIHGFGSMIMQGQFATGVVIFLILMIINFFVVTKGATRIAEVAARFSLDALPGKQLSIDAELSSGMINQEEAKKRRQSLEQQTAFFGAMDGASKFVRGDALAALLILVLNIVGGFVVGMLYHNMTAIDALTTYGFLAIGDSLVAQLPSLMVSIASGLLIARSSKRGSAHEAFLDQFKAYPKVLVVTGILLMLFGLLPGFPLGVSLVLGGLFVGAGYSFHRMHAQEQASQDQSQLRQARLNTQETVVPYANTRALVLEYAPDLVALTRHRDADQQSLSNHFTDLGHALRDTYGVDVPSIHLEMNPRLPRTHVALCLHGFEWGRYVCHVDQWHAVTFDTQQDSPTKGWEQKWIAPEEREAHAHWTLLHPFVWLTQLWHSLIVDHLADIVPVSFFTQRLNTLEPDAKKLYQDMVPSQMSAHHVILTLKALLTERIPLKNVNHFLEGLHAHAFTSQDPHDLAERLRPYVMPELWRRLQSPEGKIPIMFLNSAAEKICYDHLVGPDKKQLGLSPSLLEQLFSQIQERMSENVVMALPVLVCSGSLRLPLRDVLKQHLPQLTILGAQDIPPPHVLHMLNPVVLRA